MTESIEPDGWQHMTPAAKFQWVMNYVFEREPQSVDVDRIVEAHSDLAFLAEMQSPMSFWHALGHSPTRPEVSRALWEALAWAKTVGVVDPAQPWPAQLLLLSAIHHQMLARLADD